MLETEQQSDVQQSDLIDRYETLRQHLQELETQVERLDAEISQVEHLLPQDYVYPADLSSEDKSLVLRRPK